MMEEAHVTLSVDVDSNMSADNPLTTTQLDNDTPMEGTFKITPDEFNAIMTDSE